MIKNYGREWMNFNKKELEIISSCLYYRLQITPLCFEKKYYDTEEQKKYEKDISKLYFKIDRNKGEKCKLKKN